MNAVNETVVRLFMHTQTSFDVALIAPQAAIETTGLCITIDSVVRRNINSSRSSDVFVLKSLDVQIQKPASRNV